MELPQGTPFLFAIFLGVIFAGKTASNIRKIEADHACDHWNDCVAGKGLHNSAKYFTKVFTSGWEDLKHESCGWVVDEVALEAKISLRNNITNQDSKS